ncbi:LSm family protein [Spiroplasma mirum]|uniref:hypothetical protein n=1 Tax=Spiroplasma mirum TaxID=2144 RepID=UPI0004BBC1F0|nr:MULTISPECIES: hypothetical protein [Spiroplasma]
MPISLISKYLYLELKQPVNGLTEITGTLQAVDNNTQLSPYNILLKVLKNN